MIYVCYLHGWTRGDTPCPTCNEAKLTTAYLPDPHQKPVCHALEQQKLGMALHILNIIARHDWSERRVKASNVRFDIVLARESLKRINGMK